MACGYTQKFATFSAGEVARIVGISQTAQRDLRRRNYLPAAGAGRARFDAMQVAKLLLMKRLVDRGLVSSVADKIAAQAQASVLWFALAGSDDSMNVVGPATETTAFLARQREERLTSGFTDIDNLLGIDGERRVRFCILFEDNEAIWSNNTSELFDEGHGGTALVLDLLAIGERLAVLAGKPLLNIELGARGEGASASASSAATDPNGRLSARGLSLGAAANYLGVDVPTFQRMVDDRTMPAARRLGGVQVWDRTEIDRAFDYLASPTQPDSEPISEDRRSRE